MNEIAASPPVSANRNDTPSLGRQMLNKVPEVTLYFWIIKILCTTVGETAADFLNVNLNFGLEGTSIAAGILLAIALAVQFRTSRYVAPVYWLAVVLISGICWEVLQRELGCGSGMSCWRRLRDWTEAGVWPEVHRILLSRLREADKIDWSRAVIDSASVRAVFHGLAASWAMMRAKWSRRSASRRAAVSSTSARFHGGRAPSRWAARATATARSTSAAPHFGTRAMRAPS